MAKRGGKSNIEAAARLAEAAVKAGLLDNTVHQEWRREVANWEWRRELEKGECGDDAKPSRRRKGKGSRVRQQRKGGRSPIAQWEKYEQLFQTKIKKEGPPDPTNDKGWRTQADVGRWLQDELAKHGDTAANSTVRRYAAKFIANISAQN